MTDLKKWTDIEECEGDCYPMVRWNELLVEDSSRDWASEAVEDAPGDPRREFRLTRFSRLLQVLKAGTLLAAGGKNVELKLSLSAKPDSKQVGWTMSIEKPDDEPGFLNVVFDNADLIPRLLQEWAHEIKHYRKHGELPRERSGEEFDWDQQGDDFAVVPWQAICYDCGTSVDRPKKFCSPECQDRHRKWIAGFAKGTREDLVAEKVQGRLQKILETRKKSQENSGSEDARSVR